jgi:hypothetical protein
MKYKENVASDLLLMDENVNTIKGLDEIVEELMIVQKVLRPLPLRFDAKVFIIEETKDLEKVKMD